MCKPTQSPTNLDRLNRVQTLSVQLEALLSATTGEAGDGFRVLSDLLQGNFMWACADMAAELANILNEIEVRHE